MRDRPPFLHVCGRALPSALSACGRPSPLLRAAATGLGSSRCLSCACRYPQGAGLFLCVKHGQRGRAAAYFLIAGRKARAHAGLPGSSGACPQDGPQLLGITVAGASASADVHCSGLQVAVAKGYLTVTGRRAGLGKTASAAVKHCGVAMKKPALGPARGLVLESDAARLICACFPGWRRPPCPAHRRRPRHRPARSGACSG